MSSDLDTGFTRPSISDLWSEEAEQAVIGCVLVNPGVYRQVSGFLKASDFFLLKHRYIWEAIDTIYASGTPLDYLTLIEQLKVSKHLHEIGGPAYITRTVNNTPTSVHGEFYARIVESGSVRRQMIAASDMIKALAFDQAKTIDEIEAESSSILQKTRSNKTSDLVSAYQLSSEHYDRVQVSEPQADGLLGLPSPLNALNAITKGWQKGKLYIGAGRPGMGKTSHLTTEAAFLASRGLRVAIFTLEMTKEEVFNNIVAAEIKVSPNDLQNGRIKGWEQSYKQYMEAIGRLSKWRLYIDETSGLNPMQLASKCYQLAYEVGLDMVFVDYLQLMSAGTQRFGTRNEEIGIISRALKDLAKTLHIPVFAAAQLSRAVEQRQDKRPGLADLRESGNIEQDADMVMFYYRDDYYNPVAGMKNDSVRPVEIAIGKHRAGETGTIIAGFVGLTKQFVNVEEQRFADRVVINNKAKRSQDYYQDKE